MRAILTYHSIDRSGSPISVSPDEFRAHCRFLTSGRVRVASLRDVVTAPEGEDVVALTFDDAFRSLWDEAWPLLREHQLPATVFVVGDHVGGCNDWGGRRSPGIPHLPLMSWEQLGRLHEGGVEIGAHTLRHPFLSRLSEADRAVELDEGSHRIESSLGVRPESFAYPYGDLDGPTTRAVRARYARACTTALRLLSSDDDTALLPRLDMFYLRTPGALDAWGSPAFRTRLWVRGLGRRARSALTGGAAHVRHVA